MTMAESGVLAPKPTDVFVAPLSRIPVEDVESGIHAIDQWLRQISGDLVTVQRLEMVGQSIPVLANIFAAVDVVMDIKAMLDHGDKPLDVFDWTNLGLDLIGVVPLPPGTAQIRMGARPVLKIVRQEIAKSGKAVAEASAYVLRDAVVNAIVASLSARFAGEIEQFLNLVKAKLAEMLGHCADFIGKLMTALADLFAQAAGEQSLSVTGNLHAAERHASEIGAGFSAYDAGKVVQGVGRLFVDFLKVEVKSGINLATTVGKALDSQASAHLMQIAHTLRARIPAVTQAVRELDGQEAGKIGWLIMVCEQGLVRWRQRNPKAHAVAIPPTGQTKVVEHRPQGTHETLAHTAEAKHPGPNECKLKCPVATTPSASAGSIGFALGDEKIKHQDFVLDGPMPIVWQRTYRSFFEANDTQGELGPRWITPYTTRFDMHEAEAKLVFHDAQGRSLDYPLLQPGQSHDDRCEELILTRLDDEWLTLTRGYELLEAYERRGNVFRLAYLRNRAGNQVTLDYHDDGRLYRLLTPHVILAFKYDEKRRIVEAVKFDGEGERLGTMATYTYDAQGDLVVATDAYGNKRRYQYQHHLVTRYTDRTGRGMNLEWAGTDAKAKCVREYADDGSHALMLAWHPNFRRVDVTDALGQVTQHHYDLKGYTFRIVHPDGSEEWMRRDAHDNLTQYIHRDGGIEQLRYDARGNLVWHQRADGSVVEMAYDAQDQMVRLTDPHGHGWAREYDAAGQVTRETDPLGHATEYGYDQRGLVTEVKDAKGGTKRLAYDEAGRLIRYTDCSGRNTFWKYDEAGRLSETKDASGAATKFRYGANGQLSEVHAPGGIEKLNYDAEGRLAGHTDALGRDTRYSYDAVGRIVSRTDALGQVLAYRYDRMGRLAELTDANRARYRFAYDPVGRLIEEVAFDGKTTRYSYDEGDGTLRTVDEAGQPTQLEYDAGGRLARRVSGELEERFFYDQSGRLIDAQNAHSRLQRFFDPAGRLVREHHAYRLFGQSRSFVWHHAYDELGNRIRTIRPDGQTIDWLTYGSGHVHGMLLNGEERVQIERDELHRETVRTLSNQIGQRTKYDWAGRLAQRTVQRAKAPTPLAERRYHYDAAGQLTQIQDSYQGWTDYRYDPVGRLVEAANSRNSAQRERFAFDPASNMVDVPRQAEEMQRMPPLTWRQESTLPDEVPAVLGNLLKRYAGTHYTYDARGNLVEKQGLAGKQQYAWDAFNRLIAAQIDEANRRHEARYFYDALGRRIAKEVDGERTVFGWDGDTLAYESASGGTTHYIYEANSFVPMAQVVTDAPVRGIATPVWKDTDRYTPEGDPLQRVPQREADGHVFYYHCDQIGTPLLMTDESGETVWEASYKAWGETWQVIARMSQAAGIVPRNPVRFQGQQHDAETGLHYTRNRYYDPSCGRFVSTDPIGLRGGINLYQYAPTPVQSVDPLGLKCRPGDSSRAARREAMRQAGIPTSQQPISQSRNASGREYRYEIPAAGGGTVQATVQQQTMDVSHLEDPHWEAGKVKVDPITGETRMNDYGRPKIANPKGKAYYRGCDD